MLELKNLIAEITSLMSISGHEYYDKEKLINLLSPHFDSVTFDAVGSYVCVKKCGKENAPKIMIDTHYDEIGMIVTDIKDGGFVSVANIGGLDTRILSAADVIIYGKEKLYGVIVSTPPHLQKASDAKKLPLVSELLIDTGYSKEELAKIVQIGDPVGYYPHFTELLNGKVATKAMDDKACCAIAIHAVANTKKEELAGDVYVVLSCQEEVVSSLGARTSTYKINPDYAFVLDVGLATEPGTEKHRTIPMGGGPAISISAATDKYLTRKIIEVAKENEIKHSVIAEANGTGTNGNYVNLVGEGVPCAVISLPLKNMHTYIEVADMADAEEVSKLFTKLICNDSIGKEFQNVNN